MIFPFIKETEGSLIMIAWGEVIHNRTIYKDVGRLKKPLQHRASDNVCQTTGVDKW